MSLRELNGLPSFGNPMEEKPDRFLLSGFRKMALGVLIVNLQDLLCDPSTGRSANEREEMRMAKDQAGPWFSSDAYEAFASMAQLPVSNEVLRERCLAQPELMMQQLMALRQAIEDSRVSAAQREKATALHTRQMPANNWLFGSWMDHRVVDGLRQVLTRKDRAPLPPQAPLFDEIATPEERVAWARVARSAPVRHRVAA